MEWLGTNYGWWSIHKDVKLDNNSIFYSGGVEEDMSFDLKLEDKYNCKIFLIDPTKTAIKHYEEVKEVKEFYNTKINNFSGNIQPDFLYNIIDLDPDFDNYTYINKDLYK